MRRGVLFELPPKQGDFEIDAVHLMRMPVMAAFEIVDQAEQFLAGGHACSAYGRARFAVLRDPSVERRRTAKMRTASVPSIAGPCGPR